MISFDDFLKQDEADKYNNMQEYEAIIQQKENIINELKERSLRYSKQIDKLLDIKEEVRDYIMTNLITEWDIKNGGHVSGSDLPVEAITPILEIIDKESIE